MKSIDLRSDTVTRPTPEMLEAMTNAKLGDDVYGEDPTTNQLQEIAAQATGKDAALFIPSGTMGNLAAILSHCGRGDEVIVGNKAHTFLFEAGGLSALGGVHSQQLPNQADGSLAYRDIEQAIRPDDPHAPISRLVCLENTHNRCGGTYQTPETTNEIVELAHAHGLAVHLDGARIFNAAAAQGIDVKELTAMVDSVTFCLSKGLCAPVGSVLCGDREFIRKAHRARKVLGGGMRQTGVLAAAGIIAVQKMTMRLHEDHQRARKLAAGLQQIQGLSVMDPATNMVFVAMDDAVPGTAEDLSGRLEANGVLAGITGGRQFRLVTHYWISDMDVDETVQVFRDAIRH